MPVIPRLNLPLPLLEDAIMQGIAKSDEWEAVPLEILRIPQVEEYWRKLNPATLPAIVYHPGMPFRDQGKEGNEKIGDAGQWNHFCGWTLFGSGWTWNAVGTDGYSHAASRAWDGVRRETVCEFALALEKYAQMRDDNPRKPQAKEDLFTKYNIRVIEAVKQKP